MNFLKTEVTIAQELSDPSIVHVKDVYNTQYHALIVMDKAECSLADYIKKKGGKLPIEECKIVMKETLKGLKYLHNMNIVHRDIKPGNILLMSSDVLEGNLKITDFSISAKINDTASSELLDTAGTFLYKAPEQFNLEVCTTVRKLLMIVH